MILDFCSHLPMDGTVFLNFAAVILCDMIFTLHVCVFPCLTESERALAKDVQESVSVFMAQHRTQAREARSCQPALQAEIAVGSSKPSGC